MRYSEKENKAFKNLFKDIFSEVHVLDDPKIFGPEVKFRHRKYKGELDAILLYENIVCVVGINGSKDLSEIEKEVNQFYAKLDSLEASGHLQDIYIDIIAKPDKFVSGKEKAEQILTSIQERIKKIEKKQDIILRKIFFCPNVQFDETNLEKLRKEKKFVIDKDLLGYLSEISKRLDKQYAFRDIMHFLNIRKVDFQKKDSSKKPGTASPFLDVSRIELETDKVIMYSHSARIEDLEEFVTVLRIAQKYDKKGFQRMVKESRLNKIDKDYLSSNDTFPNNIIFALNPEVYKGERDVYNKDDKEVILREEYNSLILIDGQHRFFSFIKGGKKERQILISLILFQGGDVGDNFLSMEKMFYKINKTQEKIDPNLSFTIKARIDPASEEYFWYEVFKKLDKKSFFAGRYSFKESTLRKQEAKKSMLSVIAYGGVLNLNKKFTKNNITVEGLRAFYEGNNSKKDIDFAYYFLRHYFDIIDSVLHEQSVSKERLTPREIGAVIRLVKHFMYSNKDDIRKLGQWKQPIKTVTRMNKEIFNAQKSILSVLRNIDFKKAIDLDYPASNWAAVEGYMLRGIHSKPVFRKFGSVAFLSRKARDIYNK